MPDFAHSNTAVDQFRTLGREIGRHEVEPLQPVRRISRNKLYGTCRPWRSELDDPEVGDRMVVDVQREADLLRIKIECTVDVCDG